MPSEFSLKTIIDKMIKLRIIKESGCWELKTHRKTRSGYPIIVCYGSVFAAHRISAAYYHNLDLNRKGEWACHKNECHNKSCWNPEHLYVGTQSSNEQDKIDFGNHWPTNKIYCKMGHKLVRNNKQRFCRVCSIERSRKWREKNETLSRREATNDTSVHPVTGRKLVNGLDKGSS